MAHRQHILPIADNILGRISVCLGLCDKGVFHLAGSFVIGVEKRSMANEFVGKREIPLVISDRGRGVDKYARTRMLYGVPCNNPLRLG